ncbi:hypothetical protein [Nocardia otitidiscaviarum]|uniref:hypothetical protein n=1 Tax=Nocardia otitidiscaviarum TaxID=1823 RepID=UPI0024581B42|nr:hypothetical protein [Nocardia otitidiscaviarum]
MVVRLDDGTWLAFPEAGERDGEGGDCYAVAYFGDDELAALRYANKHPGYRAVLIKRGQTLLDAVKAQRD